MAEVYEGTARQYGAKQINSIPQYGGDCALKEDGLTSSLKRLEDAVASAVNLSWKLREAFSMSVPETQGAQEAMSGPKAVIDRAVCATNAVCNNIELILNHIRS